MRIAINEASFLKNPRKRIILFICIAIFFTLITVYRRIDSISYPQFYAEDGPVWYSQAYYATNPIRPFLIPWGGYFSTIERVGALIGTFFSIGHVPVVFNLIAIAVQISPALFFLSARFEKIVCKFHNRFLLALMYLMLPGTYETHANLTTAQFRLALLLFLVVIAGEAENIPWRIFDLIVLVLAGLSGPFVLFIFPLALAYAYLKPASGKVWQTGILAAAFMVQTYSLIFIHTAVNSRGHGPLGASPAKFIRILAGKVFITGIFGLNVYEKTIMNYRSWENGVLPFAAGILGAGILVYVFLRASAELRLFLVFSFSVLAAALAKPLVSITMPQWDLMADHANIGNRYFLYPILAWVLSLIWLSKAGKGIFRGVAMALILCLIFIGMRTDFFFVPYENYHFQKQIAKFEKIPNGKTYSFKIPPNWEITLTKANEGGMPHQTNWTSSAQGILPKR